MTDNDIKKFVAMLCSEDLSNVLLAIEMFEPLHHYDKEAVADAFLKRMSGEIIDMYGAGLQHVNIGQWECGVFNEPKKHSAFGLFFESEWSCWVEMDIEETTTYISAHMSGKGNFHAVGYKLYIESHDVYADLRVHEGYNPFYKCMEFFFESMAPIIRNYINDQS